eukprot:CAMPEP_0202691150 /NCGR_PEP_ID=MMETSP1385-20130828/5942_1 /ASSEMBLY_ACC=CAM_ASM_000861 /TAXON_ID=933848 /ORGANISM="Elphidium margaritaceum" /LENGTH=771 /DNA_ID=CAMNT_0049346509 /DNA_START=54 /DNA_END=2369 /DNA_ORIENTATION=+
MRGILSLDFGEEGREGQCVFVDQDDYDDDDKEVVVETETERDTYTIVRNIADIGHDKRSESAEEEEDDRPLLPLQLSFTQPAYCRSLSFSKSNEAPAIRQSPAPALAVPILSERVTYPTPQQSSTESISKPAELLRLKQWLHINKLAQLYQSLLQSGIDSVDLLAEADDDDIRQICCDLKLKTADKLKFRLATRELKASISKHDVAVSMALQSSLLRSQSVILTERQSQWLQQHSTDSTASPAELSRLREWLHLNKLEQIYQRLVDAGFDSVDLFAETDNEDIRQICCDLKLTTAEKLKLRKSIRNVKQAKHEQAVSVPVQLSQVSSPLCRSQSVILTQQQSQCLTQLDAYRKRNEANLRRVQHMSTTLKRERETTEQRINREFSALCRQLKERKKHLLSEVNRLYEQQHASCAQTVSQLKQRVDATQHTQQQMRDLLDSQRGLDGVSNISQIQAAEEQMVTATRQLLCGSGDNDNDDEASAVAFNIQFTMDRGIVDQLAGIGQVNAHKHMELPRHRRSFSEQTHMSRGSRRSLESHPRSRRCESDSMQQIKHQHHQQQQQQQQRSSDGWSECGANLVIERCKISSRLSMTASSPHQACGYARHVVRYGRRHFWRLKIRQSLGTSRRPLVIGFVSAKYQPNANASEESKSETWYEQRAVRSVAITADSQVWCNGKKLTQQPPLPRLNHRDIINICLSLQDSNVYIQHCKYDARKYEYDVGCAIRLQIPSGEIRDRGKYGYRLACFLGAKGQSVDIDKYAFNQPFPEWTPSI